jgi:RNA polymerase sigma-70 factor (ECF subfamily)
MSNTSMQELAARLACGDEAAFEALYDRCADRLLLWLSVRLRDRHLAADVMQTAFLRAVTSRHLFRKLDDPVAYLFQIARNEANRAAKRRRTHDEPLPLDELFIASADEPARTDNEEAALAALSRLEPDDRELVVLRIYAGLSFREVADLLGRPQGTVATRYRRALLSLRSWLTKQIQ